MLLLAADCRDVTVPRMQAGVHHVQFLVDGSWMTSPELPVGHDEDGHLCNTARRAQLDSMTTSSAFLCIGRSLGVPLYLKPADSHAGQRVVAPGVPRVLCHRLAAADAALPRPARGWRTAQQGACCRTLVIRDTHEQLGECIPHASLHIGTQHSLSSIGHN